MDLIAWLPIIIGIIAVFVLQAFFSKGRARAMQLDMVKGLLLHVKLDQAMAESFAARSNLREFEVSSWDLYSERIGFLDKSLQVTLFETFSLLKDLNQQIKAAKKDKTSKTRESINLEKVKGLLLKSGEGLEQWLLVKTGSKEPPTDYPRPFDFLGGR